MKTTSESTKAMETRIFKNHLDFLLHADRYTNGVSPEFALAHPDWETMNATNRGCWNCAGCTDCTFCWECTGLSGYRCSTGIDGTAASAA